MFAEAVDPVENSPPPVRKRSNTRPAKEAFLQLRLLKAYGSEPMARRVGRRKRDLRIRHGLHGPVSAEVSQALQHAAELFELLELEKRRCLVRPIESSETLIGLTRLADLLKVAERDLARLVNARAADAADILDEVGITDPSACAALVELAELAAGVAAEANAGAALDGEAVAEPVADHVPHEVVADPADGPGACACATGGAAGALDGGAAAGQPADETALCQPAGASLGPSGAPSSPAFAPDRGVPAARPADRRADTAVDYNPFGGDAS
jgi:hypothetical protein